VPSVAEARLRRRVVAGIDLQECRPYAVPLQERVPTLAALTVTEQEYAVVASMAGSLRGVAWGMGVSVGMAKNAIQQIAAKIPGSLPAFVKVIAWTRGATPDVLGAAWEAKRIPEHLLRPEYRSQTASQCATAPSHSDD
jgi:hypothetical protein